MSSTPLPSTPAVVQSLPVLSDTLSSISNVPQEIIFVLCEHLDMEELRHVQLVCRRLSVVSTEVIRRKTQQDRLKILDLPVGQHPVKYILELARYPEARQYVREISFEVPSNRRLGIQELSREDVDMQHDDLDDGITDSGDRYEPSQLDLQRMTTSNNLSAQLDDLFQSLGLDVSQKPIWHQSLQAMNPLPALAILLRYTPELETLNIKLPSTTDQVSLYLGPISRALSKVSSGVSFARPVSINLRHDNQSRGESFRLTDVVDLIRWPGITSFTSFMMSGPDHPDQFTWDVNVNGGSRTYYSGVKTVTLQHFFPEPALLKRMWDGMPQLNHFHYGHQRNWSLPDPDTTTPLEECWNPDQTAQLITTNYSAFLEDRHFAIRTGTGGLPFGLDLYKRPGTA